MLSRWHRVGDGEVRYTHLKIVRVFGRVRAADVGASEQIRRRPVERLYGAVASRCLDPISVQPLARVGVLHVLATFAVKETVCSVSVCSQRYEINDVPLRH